MPESVPSRFFCECGQVLINHYPSQIIKHRLSKKHAQKLMDRIKDIENKELEIQKEKEKLGSIPLDFT